MPKIKARVSDTALLGLLLFTGFLIRFIGVGKVGIGGSDPIYYWNLAREWSQGNSIFGFPCGKEVFRPVILALYAAVLKVFGPNDTSIKFLNIFADIVTALLIFQIAKKLHPKGIGRWLSLGLYLLMPKAIYFARSENLATMSTFFLVLTTYFYLGSFRVSLKGQVVSAIATGLAIGLGTFVHEDLLFCTVGLGAYELVLWIHSLSRKDHLRERWVVWASGLVSLVGTLSALGIERLVEGHGHRLGKVISNNESLVRKIFSVFVSSISANTSTVYTISYLTALLVCLWLLGKTWKAAKEMNKTQVVVLPLMILGHQICYLLLMKNVYPRVFFPFVALSFAFVPVTIEMFIESLRLDRRVMQLCSWITGMLLICSNLFLFGFPRYEGEFGRVSGKLWSSDSATERFLDWMIPGYGLRSPERYIFDLLKGEVSENSRILVTPYSQYPWSGRRALQIYFGDSVRYIIDSNQSIERTIDSWNVSRVIFFRYHNDRRLDVIPKACRFEQELGWIPGGIVLGQAYNMPSDQYSTDLEYTYWDSNFKRLGFERRPANPNEPFELFISKKR